MQLCRANGPGLVALGLCLCGLSCSSQVSLNPVQGKVLFKQEPLKGALVTFHPKDSDELTTLRPTGLTKDDGSFTLTTGQKDGAPAGEYIITIICSEVQVPKGKEISTGGLETQDRLKGAYADRNTSKISVTVKSGQNQLEPFDLK